MKAPGNKQAITAIIITLYYCIFCLAIQRIDISQPWPTEFTEPSPLFRQIQTQLAIERYLTDPLPFSMFLPQPDLKIIFPICSSALTGLLLYAILKRAYENERDNNFLQYIISGLFIFHPGIIISAVSGSSNSLLLLLFYLYCHYLFRYFRAGVTYYVSLSSVMLCGMLVYDARFIILILCLLPFMLLISLEMSGVSKTNSFIKRYGDTINNRSLRRKLIRRAVALTLLLFLLPVGVFFVCAIINNTDPMHYLTGCFRSVVQLKKMLQPLSFPLLTCALFAAATFKKKQNKIFEFISITSVLLFIVITHFQSNVALPIAYYLLLVILGLVLLIHRRETSMNSRYRYLIITGFILSITGGVQNAITFRKGYANKVFSFSETEHWAIYIKSGMRSYEHILMEDHVADQIFQRKSLLNNAILSSSLDFLTVVEEPINTAQYIFIEKETGKNKPDCVLNEKYAERLNAYYKNKYQKVHETANFVLLHSMDK